LTLVVIFAIIISVDDSRLDLITIPLVQLVNSD